MRLPEFVVNHSAAGRSGVVAHQGNASSCILSFPQKEHMEGIVMGTRCRRGFDRLVLGSTTDRVIRKATCPVLAASVLSHQALVTGPNGRHRLRRILYCTEFSKEPGRARGYVISFGRGVWRRADLMQGAEKVANWRGRRQSAPSVHKNR